MTPEVTAVPSLRTLLKRTLRIVLKRIPLFLVMLIAVTGGGIAYTLLRPPVFVTKATVMFERASKGDASSFLSMSPLLEEVPPQEFFKSVLNSVLYRKRLAEALMNSNYKLPPNRSLEESILRNLAFSIQKSNAFADITSRDANGQSAYIMVELALSTFIERSKEIQREELSATLDFLNEQLEVISQNLEGIEREIQEFQEKHQIDPADVERGVWGEIYDLQHQLVETQVAFSLEKLNNQAYTKRFNEIVNDITSELGGVEDSSIKEMKAEITDLHAEYDSLLQSDPQNDRILDLKLSIERKQGELINNISTASIADPKLKQERSLTLQSIISKRTESDLNLVALQNQLQFLNDRIERFKNEHPDLLESALSFAGLIRSREVFKDTYDLLTEKREEAKIQAASETGGIKVIDPPYVPRKPENPRNSIYIAVSLILGLLFSFGVCFATDLIDDSFKDPDDVEEILKITVLGTIPLIRPNKNGQTQKKGRRRKSGPFDSDPHSLLIHELSPDDPVVESYRALKTNITFLFPDTQLRSLTISSPQASEGKSITSANLAISFAISGIKTLLIECDLRRPLQHTLFDLPSSPGLSDALFNDMSSEVYFNKTDIDNLHVVAEGSPAANPADLLSSDKMTQFIKLCEQRYDLVLLDTPPITFAVDARILATKTQGLILIVQNEKTRIEYAKQSLSQIKQVGGKVVGAVVNMVNSRNYYKNYYYIDSN